MTMAGSYGVPVAASLRLCRPVRGKSRLAEAQSPNLGVCDPKLRAET